MATLSSPTHNTPLSARAVANAFSARVRLLQKKKLKWTSAQWQEALVAWSEGKLAPGMITPQDGSEPFPCAYIECYGRGREYIVVTQTGVYAGTADHLNLVVATHKSWDVTEDARTNGRLLEVDLELADHSLHTMAATSTLQPAYPACVKDGASVQRFGYMPWGDLLQNIDTPPTFPDRETCFTWLHMAAAATDVLQADPLFELLTSIPQIACHLQTEDDWLVFTQKFMSIRLTELDKVISFPCVTDSFAHWLFTAAAGHPGNIQTKTKLLLAGLVPEGLDQGLEKLIHMWTTDNADEMPSAIKLIREWHALLPQLCIHQPPGQNVREWLWKYHVDAHLTLTQFVTASHAIHAATPDAHVSERWLVVLRRHVVQNKAKIEDVPTQWGLAFIADCLVTPGMIATNALLSFTIPYLKETDKDTGMPLLARILQSFNSEADATAILEHAYTVCCFCWPALRTRWDILQDLDVSVHDWGDALNELCATPLPLVTLPSIDMDSLGV